MQEAQAKIFCQIITNFRRSHSKMDQDSPSYIHDTPIVFCFFVIHHIQYKKVEQQKHCLRSCHLAQFRAIDDENLSN
jgi:hypothetical protein